MSLLLLSMLLSDLHVGGTAGGTVRLLTPSLRSAPAGVAVGRLAVASTGGVRVLSPGVRETGGVRLLTPSLRPTGGIRSIQPVVRASRGVRQLSHGLREVN